MGDIDIEKLKESFLKIRKDIEENSKKIKELEDENSNLRKNLIASRSKSNDPNETITKTIRDSVKEVLESMQKPRLEKEIMNRYNRNKKNILRHKILDLVGVKEMSLGELKDLMVDEQHYCSRATFYRYIDSMAKRNLIEIISADEKKTVCLAREVKLAGK